MTILLTPRRRQPLAFWVIAPLVALIVALILLFFIRQNFGSAVASVAIPLSGFPEFMRGEYSLAQFFFKSKTDLLEENRNLSEELIRREMHEASWQEVKKENEELKALFDLTDDKKSIGAKVAFGSYSFYGNFIVEKGSNDGVHVGDGIWYKEFRIGTILEVFPNHSKAEVLSKAGREIKISFGGGVVYDAFGKGAGNFGALIPKGIELEVGDSIYLDRDKDIPFSIIASLKSKETDSFQNVFFTMPVNIREISWVEIKGVN